MVSISGAVIVYTRKFRFISKTCDNIRKSGARDSIQPLLMVGTFAPVGSIPTTRPFLNKIFSLIFLVFLVFLK